MNDKPDITDGPVLIRDFDSIERGHSRPKFEAELIDSGDTVAIHVTNPLTEDKRIQYVPRDVLQKVAKLVEEAEEDHE